MKDSCVPWLGDVPEHWEVRKLRRVLTRVSARSRPDLPLLSVVRSKGVILRDVSSKDENHNFVPDDLTNYKVVRSGQFAMNKMKAWQGSYGVSTHEGIVSPAYYVFDVHGVLGSFFHAALRSSVYVPSFTSASDGVRIGQWDLNDARMREISFAVPPPEEQVAIVRFLDWANGRLERAIRAKRKVIALLNEQKQAIIHRAVTCGLDPNAPLKPSGIEWLGDIPAHWEVRRIKLLLREVDERSSTGAEPLLSMRMHHGLVLFSDHFTRPPQAATLVGFKIVRPGQFVVNRMQAGNGVIFASALTGLVSPDYAVFDPIGNANIDFLGELFRSRAMRAKFRAESKGLGTGTSGFLRLYNDRLGAIHVALPPCVEQSSILARLAQELSIVNTTISRLEREIELLREYRTRLVADVVTGKLDVRAAAAQLPDEAPPEPAEDDTDGDAAELEEVEA
jgi:type I restriction enzyme S subunit